MEVQNPGNGYEFIEFKPDDVLYENVSYDALCDWLDQFKTLTIVVNDTKKKTFIKCSSEEIDKLFDNYVFLQYLLMRIQEHYGYEIEYESS